MMREFFKGWRRKAGCVALAMACLVMGMWIRSTVVADIGYLDTAGERRMAVSLYGHLRLYLFRDQVVDPYYTGPRFWADSVKRSDPAIYGLVGIGEDKIADAPYWSATIPLTFLSAYLLLWKPRKRTGAEHA